jgi:hypothetical protein
MQNRDQRVMEAGQLTERLAAANRSGPRDCLISAGKPRVGQSAMLPEVDDIVPSPPEGVNRCIVS